MAGVRKESELKAGLSKGCWPCGRTCRDWQRASRCSAVGKRVDNVSARKDSTGDRQARNSHLGPKVEFGLQHPSLCVPHQVGPRGGARDVSASWGVESVIFHSPIVAIALCGPRT